jgi:hypothetical protein
MKLYATVTSERASKGQGGNKMLKVDITLGDERIVAGYLVVNADNPEKTYRIAWYSPDTIGPTILADIPQAKGEKQKGECAIGWCAEHQTRHL